MKSEKFVIQDEQGRFLWRMGFRSGVHFENERMPLFADMHDRTKLYSSKEEATNYAVQYEIARWTRYKVIPVIVTVALKVAKPAKTKPVKKTKKRGPIVP